MNKKLEALFIDNLDITKQIEAFCQQDPDFSKVKQEFYETADEVAAMVGYDVYNRFEQRFGIYVARANDLHYFFGLGLRQEVISALQPKMT